MLTVALPSEASRPYEPKVSNPVTQDFAWTWIEKLADYRLTCLDVSSDGTLWLGGLGKIFSYDGQELTQFGAEEGVVDATVLDIMVTDSGAVYAFLSQEILLFCDGRWESVYQGQVNNEAHELSIEDSQGVVWAAGTKGIFQIEGDRVLLHDSEGEPLSSIFEDQLGLLWTVAARNGTTYRIERKNGMLPRKEEWELMLEDTTERRSRYGFGQSLDGLLWRFSSDPVDPTRFYDPRSGEWGTTQVSEFGESNQVQGQFRTRDGILWAVSDGVLHGLKDGKWSIHRPLSSRHGPMRATLAQAPNGDLWLLHFRVSLHRIDYAGRRWSAIDEVLFQFAEKDGARWFLSEAGEVVRQRGQDWEAFDTEDGLLDAPVDLLQLSSGAVWAVGSDRGVAAVSIFHEGVWTTRRHQSLGEGFSAGVSLELENGEVLIGLARRRHWENAPRGALLRLNREGNYVEGSLRSSDEIPSRVLEVVRSDEGEVWINEGYRLFVYENGVAHPSVVDEWRARFWIDDITFDSEGWLWLTNWGAGVQQFGMDGQLIAHTERNGLSSRFVSELYAEPETGTLYALTSVGLDRFDGSRWHPVGKADNIINNRHASFLREGNRNEIWIAQGNQVWFDRVFSEGPYASPQGEVFRSLVYRSESLPPDTFVEVTHLPTTENRGLSVSWRGEDPWSDTPSRDLRFSYRIDEEAWSGYGTETQHSFHQLDDGEHILQVRARDQDFNVDPTPVEIRFSIPPPLWRQPWFIVALGFLIVLILYLLGLVFRQRWQHVIEYDAQRISFFTNISHELRTPLSLVLAPLQKALAMASDNEQGRYLKMAIRSAGRLNQLVDQLLEFRKIESNAMTVDLSDGDLVAQIQDIVASFQSLADQRQQALSFNCMEESRLARYDSDKFQKIVSNLISNAVKYTPRGGRIRVSLELPPRRRGERRDRAEIRVEDNGGGISANRQRHIFQPFYRGDNKGTEDAVGTGLGLSLTKQLVSVMGGKIEVMSPINQTNAARPGTEFLVEVPLEAMNSESVFVEKGSCIENANTDLGVAVETQGLIGGGELRILLLDDNEDILEFVGGELAQRYEVSMASDGEEGLRKAKELVPDLIIADVMMPRMNGFEFCRRLKSERATSHIPVIMLTARSSKEAEQHGLEAGADEYLSKPISMQELGLRISNLLATRARLQERLRRAALSEPAAPETESVSDVEEAFIKQVISLLEANLREGKYGVNELADAMHMSRSSFYRKIKAVSGETPNDFLRRFRLQRAGQLLRGTTLSVIEVMYEVGYQDLGHFGRLFKAQFHCAPSEFRAKGATIS